jgi:DNA invertase Pin-like site-specific DNA recombinase
MKAIIVARVSTEEQREANNSLPAQLNRMRDYCERNDYAVIQEYSFDESAYKTKRDEFDKIIDYVNKSTEKKSCGLF